MQRSETGKTNLLALDPVAMQSFFRDLGEKPFRAGQVIQWIHRYGVDDFEAMTNLILCDHLLRHRAFCA